MAILAIEETSFQIMFTLLQKSKAGNWINILENVEFPFQNGNVNFFSPSFISPGLGFEKQDLYERFVKFDCLGRFSVQVSRVQCSHYFKPLLRSLDMKYEIISQATLES